MTPSQLFLAGVLVVALIAQALWPKLRLLIVLAGAAVSSLGAAWMGIATAPQLLAQVPWDVLVLLVALGLLTEVLVASRIFGLLAVRATALSRASPRGLLVLFAVGMYAVSGLVNNLTALLLVLPILLVVFKLLGVRQRYVSWALGLLLVACNLGGAATPIGDFPAILLLGSGAMEFTDYLVAAAPATFLALALLIGVIVVVVRPERSLSSSPLSARLTLATLGGLYRNVRVEPRILLPALGALGAMLIAWVVVPRSTGVTPDLIAWLGAGIALAAVPRLGETLVRRKVDVEAGLFLLALFVMVGAVSRSGLFTSVAEALTRLPIAPSAQLAVFLVAAGVLTGLFSAGPAMAALLPVAQQLASAHSPEAVYVGLALSVCAGSSLFLTAATSGPLAQALTERAGLVDASGRTLRFGFFDFLPTGLVSFAVILGVGLVWSLGVLA